MRFFRILGAIILVALAVGLAGSIFQTGYLAGVAADGGVAPVVIAPGYGWGPGWGFGGGLFQFLGTLFVIVLFVGLMRAIFGGRRRHGWSSGPRGGWGPGEGDDHHRLGSWEDRARETHDEWHRRQAAGGTDGSSTPGAPGSPGTPPGGGA